MFITIFSERSFEGALQFCLFTQGDYVNKAFPHSVLLKGIQSERKSTSGLSVSRRAIVISSKN